MKRLFSLLGIFLYTVPTVAMAVVPYPQIDCPPNLVGCGLGSENVLLANAPFVGQLLLMIASGAAVLFIAFAGLQMVLAAGDDGKISAQKTAIAHGLGGLIIVILSQALVSIIGTEGTFQVVADNIGVTTPLQIIAIGVSLIIFVFNIVFTAVIVYSGMRMVYAQGKSDEYNSARKAIFWSVIGAVVTNLANALVQAIANIFNV